MTDVLISLFIQFLLAKSGTLPSLETVDWSHTTDFL